MSVSIIVIVMFASFLVFSVCVFVSVLFVFAGSFSVESPLPILVEWNQWMWRRDAERARDTSASGARHLVILIITAPVVVIRLCCCCW